MYIVPCWWKLGLSAKIRTRGCWVWCANAVSVLHWNLAHLLKFGPSLNVLSFVFRGEVGGVVSVVVERRRGRERGRVGRLNIDLKIYNAFETLEHLNGKKRDLKVCWTTDVGLNVLSTFLPMYCLHILFNTKLFNYVNRKNLKSVLLNGKTFVMDRL